MTLREIRAEIDDALRDWSKSFKEAERAYKASGESDPDAWGKMKFCEGQLQAFYAMKGFLIGQKLTR